MESMPVDDLHTVKDDMNAFILGHGLARFHAFVGEEVQSVLWDSDEYPESWKDFVELAKASGVHFLTVTEDVLAKDDLDFLVERLQSPGFIGDEDDLEESRFLRHHVGKVGFIQLGFSYHGTLFLWEISTEWYDRYQQLLESVEEFGSFLIDEQGTDPDDER